MPQPDPPTTSPRAAVREMYEATADDYARMMDSEIDQQVYADTLQRLCDRMRGVPGPIIDAACGSGHMLAMVHERFDCDRELIGVDLSPRMVALTQDRGGRSVRAIEGDMTRLTAIPDASAGAVISFFAIHHLDPSGVRDALGEWRRVLVPGGQLLVAAWEGEGLIDYGGHADLLALRYRADALRRWAEDAGFSVTRCAVEPVEDFPMDAIYLEGTALPR